MTLEQARIKEGNFAYLRNKRKTIDNVNCKVTTVTAVKISKEDEIDDYDVFVVLSPVRGTRQIPPMQVNEFIAKKS